MARNQEKARSALNRWRETQLYEYGFIFPREEEDEEMPIDAKTIKKCEALRSQLIEEIGRNIIKIQDASLSDFEIRELNDEINRQLREKQSWEDRIRELGGKDYQESIFKLIDQDGREIPGNRGYKYFGRARELPGVRELFETKNAELPARSKQELKQIIDPFYYGFLDQQSEELLRKEREQELKNGKDAAQMDPNLSGLLNQENVPSQKEVEMYLVYLKQQQLLAQYAS